MTKLQAIREFCSFVCGQTIVIARDKFDDNNWAMDIENNVPRLKTPTQISSSLDDTDKIFRQNFIERCPLAKGFSHITLTLLHECGHWATRSVMNVIEYDKMVAKAPTQIEYMMIPWEHLATDWAICWLNCPANRQMAKRFEHDYFGY